MIRKVALLEGLTIDQLLELARSEGFKISNTTSRDNIIKLLTKLPPEKIRSFVQKSASRSLDIRRHKRPIEQGEEKGALIETTELTESISKLVTDPLKLSGLDEIKMFAKVDLARIENLVKKRLEAVLQSVQEKDLRSPPSTSHQLRARRIKKELPVILPNRVSSGYKELDNLLYGGIPNGYAVMLGSRSCDERELLVRRFLEEGAAKNQLVFHVATDAHNVKMLVEKYQSQFHLFVCNSQADKIIEDRPNVFKLKGVDNLTEINIALTTGLRTLGEAPNNNRRICIQILSDILLQRSVIQARQWLKALIPELKAKQFTTLGVIDPGMHSSQEVRALLDIFEGEIEIQEHETMNGLKRHLRIRKLLNEEYSTDSILLSKERM